MSATSPKCKCGHAKEETVDDLQFRITTVQLALIYAAIMRDDKAIKDFEDSLHSLLKRHNKKSMLYRPKPKGKVKPKEDLP